MRLSIMNLIMYQLFLCICSQTLLHLSMGLCITFKLYTAEMSIKLFFNFFHSTR